jgi:hypothetical protein
VNAPSSTPRGERAGTPGANWDSEVVGRGEQYTPECSASIRGICLALCQGDTSCDVDAGECIYAAPMPTSAPNPPRRDRRAIERAARRKQ